MLRPQKSVVLLVAVGLSLATESSLAQVPVAPIGGTVQAARSKIDSDRERYRYNFQYKADFIGLVDEIGSVKPQVANGVAVDPAEWPATVISRPSGCTATLVGPRILLTAAHCVGNDDVTFVYVKGKTRTADCKRHSKYSADYDNDRTTANWARTSADYAVCVIRKDDLVTNLVFEVLGAGPLFETKTVLRLLGFGCSGTTTDPDGYGVLRTAGAGVTQLPASSTNYIVTNWLAGGFGGGFTHAKGGAVCPGDSGGAAYWPVGNASRRIVGLNSRTGVEEDGRTLNGISYLSSVLTDSAYEFLKSFSTPDSGGICGFEPSMAGCRQ